MAKPLSRRNFVALLGAGALGVGIGCGHEANSSSEVIAGEEWRNVSAESGTSGMYWLTDEMEAAANERIEKHRKGKFNLRVVDPAGRAISGHKVRIKLINHAFDWGYTNAGRLSQEDELSKLRSQHIQTLFNCTTAKCYWEERWHQPIESEEGRRMTGVFRDEVDWGIAKGMRVKGHPLVWTVRKAIPRWMDAYDYPTQLKKLEAHVRDMVRVGGKDVTRWDVCNEMLWEPSLRNLPQRNWPHIESIDEILSYLEPAIHWAREENPDAIYSLNDYGLVRSGVPDKITAATQRKRYLALLAEMDRRDCLPDAIGTQCHVASWYAAEDFQRMLDDLAQGGLPIQITEFWARIKNHKGTSANEAQKQLAQLAYLHMVYTLAFAHPQVNHLSYWGGRRTFFGQDESPTEVYELVHKLIRQTWSTDEELTTNADGDLLMDGFLGEYTVELILKDGSQKQQRVLLEKERPSQPVSFSI